MHYRRFVERNGLRGDYSDGPPWGHLSGELRRLERNTCDPRHVDAYARKTGVSPGDVRLVLTAFFASDFADLDFTTWPPHELHGGEMDSDAT